MCKQGWFTINESLLINRPGWSSKMKQCKLRCYSYIYDLRTRYILMMRDISDDRHIYDERHIYMIWDQDISWWWEIYLDWRYILMNVSYELWFLIWVFWLENLMLPWAERREFAYYANNTTTAGVINLINIIYSVNKQGVYNLWLLVGLRQIQNLFVKK